MSQCCLSRARSSLRRRLWRRCAVCGPQFQDHPRLQGTSTHAAGSPLPEHEPQWNAAATAVVSGRRLGADMFTSTLQDTMRPTLLAALALSMLAPMSSAEAQFDRLKKKMGDAIAEKAGVKTPGGPREDDKLEFDDRVVEINAARLDGFMRGLEAEASATVRYKQESAALKERAKANRGEYEAKRKAYEKAEREYDIASKAYMDCQMKAAGKGLASAMSMLRDPAIQKFNERIMAMPPAEQQRFSKRMEALGEQLEAAEARKDAAAAASIKRTSISEAAKATGLTEADVEKAIYAGQKAGEKAESAATAGSASCGTQPVAPVEPKDPADAEAALGSLESYVEKAVTKASGIDGYPFGVMRERVQAFVKNANGYAFRKSELEVLRARRAELQKYEKQLESR